MLRRHWSRIQRIWVNKETLSLVLRFRKGPVERNFTGGRSSSSGMGTQGKAESDKGPQPGKGASSKVIIKKVGGLVGGSA